MPLLEYEEGRSFMHRMSPLAKFLWGAVILVWVFLMFNPLHVLLLGVAILLVAKLLAGMPLRRLLVTVMIMGIAGFFIVVLQGLLYPGKTILFNLGPFHPTLEGVTVGAAIALRILAIVASSSVIAKTTDPRDVFLSMIKLGVPYTLSYGLFAAIRFIPLMEYESETIREAQMVRGIVNQSKGGLRNRIAAAKSFLVPFIASAIRRAQQSAIALDVRAFGITPSRTYMRKLKPDRNGWIFAGVWMVLLVLYIVLVQANIFNIINMNRY
jgi:energy-coupling factor transport system permease protein